MNVPDFFWQQLLLLKRSIKDKIITQLDIAYNIQDGFIALKETKTLKGITYRLSNSAKVVTPFTKTIELFTNRLYITVTNDADNNIIECLKIYAPLVLAPLITTSRPFLIAHLAQSIDGKIATASGASKWIGNQANLIHAHRIRALVDGVLVGTNTVINDAPRLNVRHVDGENPTRLVLSNSIDDFSNLPAVKQMQTFLIRHMDNKWQGKDNVIDKTIYYEGENEATRIGDILLKLKQCGVHSILIEGGSKTVSSFFVQNTVDWLQLHIAPLIFGSGIPSISLDRITEVNECRKLRNVLFTQLDDAMMITGEPISN